MVRTKVWVLSAAILLGAAASSQGQVAVSVGGPLSGFGVYAGNPGLVGAYGYNPYLLPRTTVYNSFYGGPYLNTPYVSPVYAPYGFGYGGYGYGGYGPTVFRTYGYSVPGPVIYRGGGPYRPYGYGYRPYGWNYRRF